MILAGVWPRLIVYLDAEGRVDILRVNQFDVTPPDDEDVGVKNIVLLYDSVSNPQSSEVKDETL